MHKELGLSPDNIFIFCNLWCIIFWYLIFFHKIKSDHPVRLFSSFETQYQLCSYLRPCIRINKMIRNLLFSLLIFFVHYHVVSADLKGQDRSLSQYEMMSPFEDEADLDAFFSRDLWYSMHYSHPLVVEHCQSSKKSKKSHKSFKCKSHKSKSGSSKSHEGSGKGKGSSGGGKGKGSSDGGKGKGGGKGGKGSNDESDEDSNSKGYSDSESGSKGSSSSSKGKGSTSNISSYTRSFPSTSKVSVDIPKGEVKKVKHAA